LCHRAQRYETGVSADEVLQYYFPPAMAVISSIAAGNGGAEPRGFARTRWPPAMTKGSQ